MNNENPFRAPSAKVADVSATGELELAERGHRFAAAMIDGIFAVAIVFPVAYALGALHLGARHQSYAATLGITALAFALFAVTQGYFLKKSGQTIGKKIVGIRIVDLDDKVPGLGTLLGRRYGPAYLLNALPVAGGLLALADMLFIFRQDRRCVHDLIAKTKVVAAGPKHSSTSWVVGPVVLIIALGIAAAIVIPMFEGNSKAAHTRAKPAANAPQASKAAPAPAAAPAPSIATPHPAASPSVPAQPSAGDATSKRASDAELRKCLELKDHAAVIRCSEAAR